MLDSEVLNFLGFTPEFDKDPNLLYGEQGLPP